jgi:ElaB/YqjD/DUF883 family membrane-anchored ribosome-binding protein
MSQNTTSTDFPGTSQTGSQSGQTGSQSGSATGTASALAQEYGGKISDAASQAKDFVSDKISVVGDKIKDLQNADFAEMAENAKDYTRKNPGQALLISAAAGLLVGLILRGRR